MGRELGSTGWSPDGTEIAYVRRSADDGSRNIFVADLSDWWETQFMFEKVQVTFEGVDVFGAQFTPDGSSIAYSARYPDGLPGADRAGRGGEGSTLVSGNGDDAERASLSPDGSLLAYVCEGPHRAGFTGNLCLANADGGDQIRRGLFG